MAEPLQLWPALSGDARDEEFDSRDHPAGARQLLLVDDDRDFADSLAALLRLEGYVVEVASPSSRRWRSSSAGHCRWRWSTSASVSATGSSWCARCAAAAPS